MTSKAKKTPQSCNNMLRSSVRKRFDSSDYFLEKELTDYYENKQQPTAAEQAESGQELQECKTPNSFSTSNTKSSASGQ